MINKLLLGTDKQFIKYTLDVCVNATLSYFYTLIIATLYCNIKAAHHIPKYDKDFIIILGCQIKKDGSLTPILKQRVDRAIEFAKDQFAATRKRIVYVTSGGKGPDESIAEAEAIKNYLIANGIKKNQIIVEDKSTSTMENMSFSKTKIDEINSAAKISFATTNYHVFRSGVIANEQGIGCEGIGSKTKWYFYTNALIRKFIANIIEERRGHFILIMIINISLFILIAIGRYYNFLHIA